MNARLFDKGTAYHDHYAARVEAYVNHVLVSKGWRVSRHPKLAGVKTHPDFRVWSPAGRFITEVKVVLQDEVPPNGRPITDIDYD